jgi:hypothetical protein
VPEGLKRRGGLHFDQKQCVAVMESAQNAI